MVSTPTGWVSQNITIKINNLRKWNRYINGLIAIKSAISADDSVKTRLRIFQKMLRWRKSNLDHPNNEYIVAGVPLRCNYHLMEPEQMRTQKYYPTVANSLEETYFHPSKIHVPKFWEILYEEHPCATVCGSEVQDLTGANYHTLHYAYHIGFLAEIKKALSQKNIFGKHKKLKVLEIGSGYGYMKNFLLKNNKNITEYHTMDVTEVFKSSTHHISNGYSFPNGTDDDFDCIFSFNCLQHTSVDQFKSYSRDVHKSLKKVGHFYSHNSPLIKMDQLQVPLFFGQHIQIATSPIADQHLKELGFHSFIANQLRGRQDLVITCQK